MHGTLDNTGMFEQMERARPLDAVACSVSNFQKEVSKWASETFPHQTPHSKMTHLRKEIDELTEDTSDGEEMADCFILLLNLAEMAGVDLMTEARRKMEINRKRKWGAPDADGVCHHVKQNDPGSGDGEVKTMNTKQNVNEPLPASVLFAPLRDQLRIQGSDGNWNYDAYMQGMYNGLECALATLEHREPQYRSKPEEGWIHDRIQKDFVPQVCDAVLDDGANAEPSHR